MLIYQNMQTKIKKNVCMKEKKAENQEIQCMQNFTLRKYQQCL